MLYSITGLSICIAEAQRLTAGQTFTKTTSDFLELLQVWVESDPLPYPENERRLNIRSRFHP